MVARRIETSWDFPAADDDAPGTLPSPGVGSLHPLWPGVQEGRPPPVYSYAIPEAQYLADEVESETKHEYVDGFVYAMAGASDRHVGISLNISSSIHNALRGTKCRDYSSDMRLYAPTKRDKGGYYYPDYFITCKEEDFGDDADLMKKSPVFVVEVVSPGTERIDRSEKLDNYKRISSIQQYWIVNQDQMLVTRYTRKGRSWVETIHTERGEVLAIPGTELSVTLDDVYQDLLG